MAHRTRSAAQTGSYPLPRLVPLGSSIPSATSSSCACFFAQVMMLVSGFALQPNTIMHVAMTHVVYLRSPHTRFVSGAGKHIRKSDQRLNSAEQADSTPGERAHKSVQHACVCPCSPFSQATFIHKLEHPLLHHCCFRSRSQQSSRYSDIQAHRSTRRTHCIPGHRNLCSAPGHRKAVPLFNTPFVTP